MSSSHSKFTSNTTNVRFQNKCYVSQDGVAHCQSYYESNTTYQTQNYKKEIQQQTNNQLTTSLTNPISTKNVQKRENEEASLNYKSTQQQPSLCPNVAKLFRGEFLPSGPPNNNFYKKIIQKKMEEVKVPENYKEQIKICVANPGRFMASWTLLTKLFGEPQLYDYIRKNEWSKEELKEFEINEELDY
uniref:Uncharacterized protein n=1 Tax=Meloidogyne enterolobii TaxID=390850 RepID=A0A6V7U8V5_MELEN|nr:unnamed protein product [Meloidogyne enterolobii]